MTQIRPLLYVSESMIRDAARRLDLPVVHNPCPADGYTKRQEVKELIVRLEGQYPRLKEYVFSAMQRLPLGDWGPRELKRRPPTEEYGHGRGFPVTEQPIWGRVSSPPPSFVHIRHKNPLLFCALCQKFK